MAGSPCLSRLAARKAAGAPCRDSGARIEAGFTITGTRSMAAIIGFVFFIINSLLGLLVLALVITAILSWLVAFDVVNLRNTAVRQIYYTLERVTEPLLTPIRRFVPPLGGVDLSFIVLFLIIQGIRNYLSPALQSTLLGLVG
jgi:YggT family protein